MINLSKEARNVIRSIVNYMKEDTVDLSDIEFIVDLIEGEIEENHPNIRVTRTEIRRYLLHIMKGDNT